MYTFSGIFYPAVTADGVELVDEHDRRGVAAGDPEQAPDPGRAEAGEHLDERGRRLGVERGARLVGDGLGEQCLAGPGRTVEEDALGHGGADLAKPRGVAQVVHDLAQLLLGLLGTGDVVPADRGRG